MESTFFNRPVVERLRTLGPFGFGAAGIGNLYREVTDEAARAVVEEAWRVGVRYFDTAPYYGFGLSEKRLGQVLRQYPRQEYVLSTKVGRILKPCEPAMPRHGFYSSMPFEPVFDYTYDGILRSFEDSINRLGIGSIDILLMHDIGDYTHGASAEKYFLQATREGGFRAMQELREQGKVGAIGLGVNEIEVCRKSLACADLDIFMVAGRHTLLECPEDDSFLALLADRGLGLIQAGIFNSGILATGSRGQAHFDYEAPPASITAKVMRLEEICDAFAVPLAAAAFQFAAAIPQTAATVVGTANPRRVSQTVQLAQYPIPDQFWRDLAAAQLLPRSSSHTQVSGGEHAADAGHR